jgi:hypothetical protein
VYEYTPIGRRNVGRGRKRWKTNTHEDGTSLDGLYPAAAFDDDDNHDYHDDDIMYTINSLD